MKKYLFLIFLLVPFISFSQNEIDNAKVGTFGDKSNLQLLPRTLDVTKQLNSSVLLPSENGVSNRNMINTDRDMLQLQLWGQNISPSKMRDPLKEINGLYPKTNIGGEYIGNQLLQCILQFNEYIFKSFKKIQANKIKNKTMKITL